MSAFLSIRSRTDVSASDAFDVVYTRRPELRAWDVDVQYKRSNPYTGYISFTVKNNTKGRLLTFKNNKVDFGEDTKNGILADQFLPELPDVDAYPYSTLKTVAKDYTLHQNRILADLKKLFFNPGPKFVSSPSMPAFNLSFYPLYRILGWLYRLIYWACILLVWFDVFTRFKKNKSLGAMPLIRYCFVYFGITFIGLFELNNRPVYTQSNKGLHHSIHRDHILFGEMGLDGNHTQNAKNLMPKSKFTDYGTNRIVCDRFFFELILYFLLIIASFIIRTKKKFYFIKAIRFPFILAISLNLILSCFYMVYNRWWGPSQTFYTKFCSVVAIVMFVLIGFEIFLFLISSLFLLNEKDPAKLSNTDSYPDDYYKNDFGETRKPQLVDSDVVDSKHVKDGKLVRNNPN